MKHIAYPRRFFHRPINEWRLRSRYGQPRCAVDWTSQQIFAHVIPFYIALIVTLTLLVQVFGVPFVSGR